MVFERHQSSRICLIPLALDTPKLWERFSLGLDSLLLKDDWPSNTSSTRERG